MRAVLARWAPVVIYMGLIFYESSQTALPSAVEHVWDKALHASGYALLALLWLWALSDRLRRPISPGLALTAWLLTVAYGASDEWHQSFVPPRQMDALDWLADAIGSAVVVAGGLTWSLWLAPNGYNQKRNGV